MDNVKCKNNGIGTLNEHSPHAFLKEHYEPDALMHEIKIWRNIEFFCLTKGEKALKNKCLGSDFVLAIILIIIGIVALILLCLDIKSFLMIGIACGSLPTGIGIMIIMLYQIKTGHSPELQRKQMLQDEERNVFIRTKTGNSAFRLVYIVVFVAFITSFFVNIPLELFTVFLMCFMPIAYFVLISIYTRKY